MIAANADKGGQSPDCFNSAGATLASQGQTLIASTAGCGYAAGAGDITGVEAKLGPLADNGGATPTHALLTGSPALDKGGGCAKTDQRGVPRTAGGACDIGAYELVRCHGRVADRTGTNGRDTLVGTPGPDAFLMLGGHDKATGLGGSDVFCGAAGRDSAKGGQGRDRAYGDIGKDSLYGGPGNDLLAGGGGDDRLRGASGRDELRGDGGEDSCNGGSGGDDTAAACEVLRRIP
jgi:Ca2+-binding RTX toxin-like protein